MDKHTKTDETVNGCTVRRWFRNDALARIDVYDPSGFRIGTYKTERGALKSTEKYAS